VLPAQIRYLGHTWQEGWISAKLCLRVDTVLYCFGKVQQGIRLCPAIILLIQDTVTNDTKGTMCCGFLVGKEGISSPSTKNWAREDHSPATPIHEYAVAILCLEGALLDYGVTEFHRKSWKFRSLLLASGTLEAFSHLTEACNFVREETCCLFLLSAGDTILLTIFTYTPNTQQFTFKMLGSKYKISSFTTTKI
jgi:hypothetical protein